MRRFWNTGTRNPQETALPVPMPPLSQASRVELPAPVLTESYPDRKRSARIRTATLRDWWTSFKETLGTSGALSDSLFENSAFARVESNNPRLKANIDEKARESGHEDFIDEIVVDNLRASDGDTHKSLTEHGGSATNAGPEMNLDLHGSPSTPTPMEDLGGVQREMTLILFVWTTLRWRLYPEVYKFFLPRFFDKRMEAQFRHEGWFTSKRLALCSSVFYVLNWLIGCVLLPSPHPLMEKIFYWGFAPALTLPLPFLVAFDFHKRHNVYYQIYVTCSTWSWSLYQSLFLVLCGFYGQRSYFSCGSKEFLGLLYYASALPAIALFGLGQQRFPAMVAAIAILILMSVWIVPFRHTWARSTVNVFVFQMFLLWLHYLRENADRRLYSLREQLKAQFIATQEAQVNEREAADSKRRLTSYIFHEVRIPLNTALLAVQNMEAHDSIPKGQDIEFTALKGSLNMMSKVLNDVLDFNRMDSGRFELVSRPYSFHTVLRSMFIPLQLAADARGLELHTDIDRRIDQVSRTAWYQAQRKTSEWIEDKLSKDPDDEGIVVGDEMRLRQIITNLASNACKFTSMGGSISVRTRLIAPSLPDQTSHKASGESTTIHRDASLSAHRLNQHNFMHDLAPLESIVVRIEIQDTGAGIRSRDLVDNKLFSPYVQTEIGRTQGGKGTGLGLALVRHIVLLSRGRLGVHSQPGVGSTFWVELRLGVGRKALLRRANPASDAGGAFGSSLSDNQSSFHFDDTTAPSGGFHGESGTFPSGRVDAPPNSLDAREGHVGFLPMSSSHAASALKTIMEQGGLVELATMRPTAEAISEFIDVSPKAKTPDGASAIPTMVPASPPTEDISLQLKERPTHIPLPERDSLSFFTNYPSTPSIPSSPGVQRTITQTSSSTEPFSHLEGALHALVVDDDYVTRHLMARLLTRLGVSVTCAENGAIALDLILGTEGKNTTSNSEKALTLKDASPTLATALETPQQEPRFDIIYLDNQMPVMSGLDVVRRLRAMGRTDFVVGVTGNALLSDQNEYIDAGVNKVLTKPVHERSLKSALHFAEQLKKQKNSLFSGSPKSSTTDQNGPVPPSP